MGHTLQNTVLGYGLWPLSQQFLPRFCDPAPKPPIVGQKRDRCGHLILPESHGASLQDLCRKVSRIRQGLGWG